MSFQIEHRGRSVHLEGEMTIYSAGEMKDQVLSAMNTGDAAIILDLSQVTELDTAGLQILLMARRLAAQRGRRFSISAPSAAARDVLDLCGLHELVAGDNEGVS